MTTMARVRPLHRRTVLVIVALTVVTTVNFWLITLTDWSMLRGGAGADWAIFGEAGRRIREGGDLYAVEPDYAFRYSPFLAWLFVLIAPIGATLWRALHVIAALSLPSRGLALATLLAWPFWFDVEAGNLVTFAFALAAWALTGRGWAIGAYLGLLLLVPRPLMMPVAAWLLWQHPQWRMRFIAMVVVSAVAVALTGWGPEWIAALLASTDEMKSALNFGPSRLIGVAWIPIGIAIAAILTWRGRLGLASVAASPYWLPYYFLFTLLELVDARPGHHRGPSGNQSYRD
jgi:hypothetical protein